MWTAIVVLIIVFFATGGVGMVIRLVEGRRKFLLDLKEKEVRIAEAKAKELEIQHKRAELEYREALLELERFDRRTGLGKGGLPPELDPGNPPPDEDQPR
jgi:hypothetical protein